MLGTRHRLVVFSLTLDGVVGNGLLEHSSSEMRVSRVVSSDGRVSVLQTDHRVI